MLATWTALLAGCVSPADTVDESRSTDSAADVSNGQPSDRDSQVIAVVRRAEIPGDLPTDAAWEQVDERVIPQILQGMWRGNGLRIGVIDRGELGRFGQLMPDPIGSGESTLIQSPRLAPLFESAQLSEALRFEVDLTKPPYPRQTVAVKGGGNSRLRLLARVQTLDDGRYQLVIVPQHYVPSRFDLIPRSPFDKMLDGSVFDPLTARVTLGPNQIAIVAMHWPWPEGWTGPISERPLQDAEPQQPPPATSGPRTGNREADSSEENQTPQPIPADDPAAPPPHLRGTIEPDPPAAPPEPMRNDPASQQPVPPLPLHLGSAMLSGERFGKPVQVVMLITIEKRSTNQPTIQRR